MYRVHSSAHTYDARLRQLAETLNPAGGGLIQRTLTRAYDTTTGIVGRSTGFSVAPNGGSADYTVGYGYDTKGRLNHVTGPGLPGAVDYSTYDQTDLVEATTFKDSGGTAIATATRTFESNRNLVASVENKWGTTTVSKYAYVNDTLGRRTSVVNSGTAFASGGIPGRFSLFGYDDRSQLTGSQRYEGTDLNDQDTPVDLQQYEFEYDSIGNRKSYTADGVLEGVRTYTSNNLNQYTLTVSLNERFTYDADGNLTEDGEYTYVWDAENRLIEVKPIYPESMRRPSWIKMQYDYLGRRIRKLAYEWQTGGFGTPGSWPTNPTSDTRFVYDGWNLLMELDGLNSNAVLRQYTWGLDLSGQNGNPSIGGIHGAGGIGGLLAMRSGSGTSSTADDGSYLYFYNANGDIGQLMKTSNEGGGYGTTAARFEYYPFGGDLVSVFNPSSGSNPARNNPFRFSTKYRDNESKCYYYGYRYLRPKHGRWISRDPIGEKGGMNRFAFVANLPISKIDILGLTYIEDGMIVDDRQNSRVLRLCDGNKTKWSYAPGHGYFELDISAGQHQAESSVAIAFIPDKKSFNKPGGLCCQNIKLIQSYRAHVDTSTWNDLLAWFQGEVVYDQIALDGTSLALPYYPGTAGGGSDAQGDVYPIHMVDNPGWFGSFRHVKFDAETCAVCAGGRDCGSVLGCINWGHEFISDEKGQIRNWSRYVEGVSWGRSIRRTQDPRRDGTMKFSPLYGHAPTMSSDLLGQIYGP